MGEVREADPADTLQVKIDMAINEAVAAIRYLNEQRTNNEARQYLLDNERDLDLACTRLTRIVSDLGVDHAS
jgi:hypothetical protein